MIKDMSLARSRWNKQTKKRKDDGVGEMRMWTEKGKEGAQGELGKEKGFCFPFVEWIREESLQGIKEEGNKEGKKDK